MTLFDPNVVYPLDEVGPYIELEGKVAHVGKQDNPDHEVLVTVQTKHGEFKGVTSRPPRPGFSARIRVYNAGGGFYPDNRITGWSSE